MTSANHDSISYKNTTKETWRKTGPAWYKWISFISDWISPATKLMLKQAQVSEGKRVLDIAAGSGEQALRAAEIVGPDGYVLATDFSPHFLEYAAHEIKERGLTQMETGAMDAEHLELEDESFDAVICRLGLMFLPDKIRGISEARRVLKPGGRIAAVVFSAPEKNPFFKVPVEIMARHGVKIPEPGHPWVFSLGDAEHFAEQFKSAGFTEVKTECVSAVLKFSSAKECVAFERQAMGALHHMMRDLPEETIEKIWTETEEKLKAFETEDGFCAPTEWIVASGTK